MKPRKPTDANDAIDFIYMNAMTGQHNIVVIGTIEPNLFNVRRFEMRFYMS